MKKLCLTLSVLLLAGACSQLRAQEAESGFTVPLVVTGGFLDTDRGQADDPSAATLTAGFHVLAEPQLKLGPHWYVYSAVQVRSLPFFYQDTYDAERGIKTDLLQGFVGYTRSWNKTAISVKAGKLSSAFGSFPLEYNDAENPLLDQPMPYTYLVPGYHGKPYGYTPVTLYGLYGAELDLSWRRADARLQLTNSSPYNPKSLFDSGQHPQWTAGTGYTIRQGLRVGMSAYRGPWLNSSTASHLPRGLRFGDFPASALGVDAQWARGHWSTSGEWDRFVFDFPYYSTAPALSFGYVEAKRVINPRWYAALRAGYQTSNHPVYWGMRSATTFLPNRQSYELAAGFRPNRLTLLKAGYEWVNVEGGPRGQDNVLGVQFIVSVNPLSKAFK